MHREDYCFSNGNQPEKLKQPQDRRHARGTKEALEPRFVLFSKIIYRPRTLLESAGMNYW